MVSGDGEMPGKSSEEEDAGNGVRAAGPRPDFRVVQAEYDTRLGKTVYKDVGAMWHNVSKSGNEFYTMKIGKLKLLVFQNTKQ
ncbi:MAG: hypothetical protein NT051_01330 [Candidatus Micrarchaeota archaeon]|nr:hypothetical protein [Candidatus Micrarchaeota archaeon]